MFLPASRHFSDTRGSFFLEVGASWLTLLYGQPAGFDRVGLQEITSEAQKKSETKRCAWPLSATLMYGQYSLGEW